MPREKVFASCAAAVADVFDGATVLVSGAAGCGVPCGLIDALSQTPARHLTCVFSPLGASPDSANGNSGTAGIDPLVANGQIVKLVSALPFLAGGGSIIEEWWEAGSLEVEIIPQGTLAERLRAGGAGLGGVFLPTVVGTRFAQGRETRSFADGSEATFEPALKADFALIRAATADTLGNVVYRGAGRNLGPAMAMAATVTIAEVDQVYEPGGLDPEVIISSGIFVNRVVRSPNA